MASHSFPLLCWETSIFPQLHLEARTLKPPVFPIPYEAYGFALKLEYAILRRHSPKLFLELLL
jgi:hypothetical protein